MQSIAQFLKRALRLRDRGERALMILGMHRSGTSFLTGSLQQAGLELGRHSDWNPHNTKGNRENPDFVAFHEELLASRGKAWDDPPEGRVRWTSAERDRARQLVADFDAAARWGFKDPRALLFADAWCELLPRMRLIGIFRHPTAVARSLEARGGMPQEKALFLWRHYNGRMLELHRGAPFPLLCFDDSEAVLHAHLNAEFVKLGLCPLEDERFWAAELRHHEVNAEPVPDSCAELYRELRSRAC